MQFTDILLKAEEVRQKYNSERLSPFPFEKISSACPDLQISVLKLPEGVSGAILFDKNTNIFSILVDETKPRTRQYFTIAHELGHYFMHADTIKQEEALIDKDTNFESKILFRLDNQEYSRIETEANNFAAELIMPSELVKQAWETFRSVEECARIFNVSIVAMSIRLEKLNLITA